MTPTTTLAESMTAEAIDLRELEKTYKPVLGLIKSLLGVVPNCDKYLEIWSPAFRTYNLMVPAFLNLPAMLFGRGAPKDMVGLGLYTSSRAADCSYCAAHTCSFALRRGADADTVSGAERSPAAEAVAAMATGLSTMPNTYSPHLRAEVERHFGAADTEWIGLGVVMMGFLNKFMDAMGVDLEPESIADVSELIGPTGWSSGQHDWALPGGVASTGIPKRDDLALYGQVIRNAPGAVRLERTWLAGIPSDQAEMRRHIDATFGIDEPGLTRVTRPKVARALAGMLAENLRADQSVIGLANKARIAQMFADFANSDQLRTHAAALTRRHGRPDGTDKVTAAIDALIPSIAPSPAEVTPTGVIDLRVDLTAEQVVECIAWVSMLQLLHRLNLFLN